jgi:mono/diheme cytochrome c family protein
MSDITDKLRWLIATRRSWEMKRTMVWSIVLTMLLASGQAQAQEREVGGLSVAKAVCARCHAVEKNSPPSRNKAAPRFEDIANSGITAGGISKAVQTTPHRMPNFRMNRGVLDDLVNYILSLKANR